MSIVGEKDISRATHTAVVTNSCDMSAPIGPMPQKRRLETDRTETQSRSTAQKSRARKVERTKDLEKRVASLTRMRDALTFKNRMMKQFIDVKTATLAKETHVTSYLRFM